MQFLCKTAVGLPYCLIALLPYSKFAVGRRIKRLTGITLRLTETVRPTSFARASIWAEGGRANRLGEPQRVRN